MQQHQSIIRYIHDCYQVRPECLWQKLPDYAVFRHQPRASNKMKKGKWFALTGRVSFAKLGLPYDGDTHFLNIKCPPHLHGIWLQDADIMPAYHMNKEHWLSVLLDRQVDFSQIKTLIDTSYDLTK